MDATHVYDLALRCLAQRPHGIQELTRKLHRKGAPRELVAQAIARCLEQGYLNDAAFAEALTRDRMRNRQCGPLRVRADLRARGVAEADAATALENFLVATDLVTLARAARDKRFGSVPPSDRVSLKKQYDFLVRRGFDADTIWQLLG
ncbi:MAG: regulatory protein RecX [Magnetococcales bacterium]|nr:regulatory protein RecX [Magnetococcales bacterium]MBF0322530.1 regulatory protein RecX [Magnetococcales bacterium]